MTDTHADLLSRLRRKHCVLGNPGDDEQRDQLVAYIALDVVLWVQQGSAVVSRLLLDL